ncbi:MAG: ATP-binding protein, partial [Endomicrobium sp.]|nr:ATP-binding protein [Endomicrobium sp.]
LDDTAIRENITLTKTKTQLIHAKFSELIEKLHQSTGQQVVVLIDEYDKPMIDSLAKEIHQEIKEILHSFYQVIKAGDAHIKFVFMTGVSRFSGLNNLNDITMDYKYTTICGYTQKDLESNFKEHLKVIEEYMGISKEELLSKIKHWYNGYSWDGKSFVYNPFSTLMFFDKKEFIGYWYKTGTPIFLIEQIKKKSDIDKFRGEVLVSSQLLEGNSSDYSNIESVTLLFQTGYLTVKKKESNEDGVVHTLDFPNKEVKDSFLTILVSEYAGKNQVDVFGLNIRIQKALKSKNAKDLQEALKELYANAIYDTDTKKEGQRQTLFVFAARLSGFEVESEVHTNKGRIDVVLKKGNTVIIVEIKYSKENNHEEKLKEAIDQIREKNYYEKYINNNPTLLAIIFSENKDIACRFENI